MNWFAECVEKDGLFAIPGKSYSQGAKKRPSAVWLGSGSSSLKPPTFALDGSWLTLKKLVGSNLELAEGCQPG
jgi:hypothetical protein